MTHLSQYNKTKSIALVASLLLDPKFHANTVRVEALIHQLIAECTGEKIPTTRDISYWLNDYPAVCNLSYLEDPPEDTFVSKVSTKWGDFRLYGGIWESYAFYLQRVINIIETIPSSLGGDSLLISIKALLKLSEEVALRNKAKVNLLAPDLAKQRISLPTFKKLCIRAETLSFSEQDIETMQCTLKDLQNFILPAKEHKNVKNNQNGLTLLLQYPLVNDGNKILVVLPTALSWSIRLRIFKWLREKKILTRFYEQLTLEYVNFIRGLPIYGKFVYPGHPPKPPKINNAFFLDFISEIDPNRFIHILLTVDTLNGLEENGINKPSKDGLEQSREIEQRLLKVRKELEARPGFKEGFTILILAGYGRARHLSIARPSEGWDLCAVSAEDLETMVWSADVTKKTIWTLVKHIRQLQNIGVEFQNVNGILNLYGWWQQCEHIMVPANVTINGQNRQFIVIPTDCIAKVRRKAWAVVDQKSACYIDGSFKQIRKKHTSTHFEEDEGSILYGSFSDITSRKLLGCALTKKRPWWLGLNHKKPGVEPDLAFRIWDAIHNWLEKIAREVDRWFPKAKDGSVLFELDMSNLTPYTVIPDRPPTVEIAEYKVDGNKITIHLNQSFLYFLHQPKNTSERAIIKCCVEGFIEWAKIANSDSRTTSILNQIIPNEGARYLHSFQAKNFRELMGADAEPSYEHIDNSDFNTLKIGLGHFASEGEKKISGKRESTIYINSLIDHLYKLLKSEIKKYNRQDFVTNILLNIEGLAADRARWDRTMKAAMDLHKKRRSVFDGKAKYFAKITAADIACRILIEIATCEAAVDAGLSIAPFDLSPLMSKVSLIFQLGNISDGIDKGEITPEIHVTPNGDVKTDQAFREEIFQKMVMEYEDRHTQNAVDTYEQNFTPPPKFKPAEETLHPDFLNAFKSEFGVTVDELRFFLQEIEDIGLKKKGLVFTINHSEIISYFKNKNLISETCLQEMLASFSLKPRVTWEEAPDGFTGRDIYPWLFRRRLSLVIKPIPMIKESGDPIYIISPGLCTDACSYILNLYNTCGMEPDRCNSTEMKKWIGDESARRGEKFTKDAADKLKSIGYTVKTEVQMSTIFPSKLMSKDYGDIDIIAWKPNENIIHLIECKKLLFAKTFREVAEQLQEFKGLTRKGKDDRLKKHLDRVSIAMTNQQYLAKFCSQNSVLIIKSLVLFSDPVPILYDEPRQDVRFSHITEVIEIGHLP